MKSAFIPSWWSLKIIATLLLFLLASLSDNLYANGFSQLLEQTRLQLGGWINGGATFNPGQTDGYNGPVVFADQSNRFQLNQLNLFLHRPVASEGKQWDWGGRFDFMFGTDTVFTQAFGVPTFDVNSGAPLERNHWDLHLCCSSTKTYGIALPQAFLEAYLPIGNGLNIKAGHFYSPTGFETVPAPDNFFYTRAYTLNVGEPFTHTGIVANYKLADNWSLMGGVITGSATGGWDGGWDKQLNHWNGLAGFTWTNDDSSRSLQISGSLGPTSASSSEFWGFYNIVFKQRLTPKTLLVLHQVYGHAGGVLLNNPKYHNVVKDAEWFSAIVHLYYDLTDHISLGFRAEWLRDEAGFRNPSPFRISVSTNVVNGQMTSVAGNVNRVTVAPADYYDFTVGANWKIAKALKFKWDFLKNLNVRPNIRYDFANAYKTETYRAFNGHKDQILFSLDFVLPF